MSAIDLGSLRRTGTEALRRGDMRTARESFERLVASGDMDPDVSLALARSCARLDDLPAAHSAVDRVLAADPRNLRALIVKADLLSQEGDARAASSFYMAAVRLAPNAAGLTADLRADIERAGAMCQRYAREFEGSLVDRLANAGFKASPATARFSQSLELLFGRRQVYFQRPIYYYFPELPQIQFYERSRFPWLDRVEAATPAIRDELMAVLEDEGAFHPYVQSDQKRPNSPGNRMLDNPEWSAFYLWKNGAPVPENAARCPKTLAALEDVPFPAIANRSPSVLFSLMRPGAHIPAHNGFVNTRLICHLPLIVPGRCHFRVGNEVREWIEGKAWVFDDTIEHEAWNRSDRTRVVLLFETWRPELDEEERRLVRTLFEAIDAHGDVTPWSI